MRQALTLTGEYYDDSFIRTDSTTGLPFVEETTVTAAGLSIEAKVLKVSRFADVKVYGTYHQFLNEGGGAGAAGGILGRFNAGTKWINAFPRSRPNTVISAMVFNRRISIPSTRQKSTLLQRRIRVTRRPRPSSRPSLVTQRMVLSGRTSGPDMATMSSSLTGSSVILRSKEKIAFGFGLQDSTGYFDSSFYAHLEFPAFDLLEFFSSYIKNNARDVASLFEGNPLTADNAVLLAGIRMTILPFLFVNAHFAKAFAAPVVRF